MTAGPIPGPGARKGPRVGESRAAEAEWEMCRGLLPGSPRLMQSPSGRVQEYIRMFLLSELASPVGKATGIREEKDT
jgi:hypothetical protein